MPFLPLLYALSLAAAPAQVHVSPQGDDSSPGTAAAPLASLPAAQAKVRAIRAAEPAPVEVLLAGGIYRLTAPLVFGPADSGSAEAPIVWQAMDGQRPVISGGRVVTGWRDEGEGVWSADVGDRYFHQLFINGRRAQRARIPNTGYLRAAGQIEPIPQRGTPEYNRRELRTRLKFREGEVANWSDIGNMHVRAYQSWTASYHWVAEVDEAAQIITLTAPAVWPMGYWEAEQRYVIENVRAGFDQPGEWYLNKAEGRLYYRPLPGESVPELSIIAPAVGQLVRLLGDAELGATVEHLTFRGLSFQHAAWVMPPDRAADGQACVQDEKIALAAAIETVGAQDCLFEDCEVTRVGPYAIRISEGSRRVTVRQCELHDLGAGGVCVGRPATAPDEARECRENVVENCFIHDGGYLSPAGIGVLILRSSHNLVRRNEVSDFDYSGVSVGWDWGFSPTSAHDNVLEYNHLHHLGRGVLSDLGGIYTLGVSPGTVLRGNIIHDVDAYSYGGWGLYNDASSSEITLEQNVVFHNKHEAYHLGNGHLNQLRNNLFVGSGEAMLYRSLNLGQVPDEPTFTIAHNVLVSDTGWMLQGRWGDGRFVLRDNLYFSRGAASLFDGLDFDLWQGDGHDEGSRIADPQISVDAEGRPQAGNAALLKAMGIHLLDDYSRVGLHGDPAWVDKPRHVVHQPLDPELKPVKPFRRPRTTIVDDFETTAVGASPAGDSGDLQLLKVTDATAGQGSRSVYFHDAPDLIQPWQPHLVYNPTWRRAGTVTGSFRLRLGPGAVITHEWRDWSTNPHIPGPMIRFGDGEVQVGGKLVAQIPVDQWFDVTLTGGVAEQATGTFDLTIRSEGQPEQVIKGLPVASPDWKRVTWVGWISYAEGEAEAWLDDLRFGFEP